MQFFQGLSLACGLGIIQGIAAYHNVPPALLAKGGLGLKWPNDLYINDKKLGGILIEGGQKIISEPFWMIIGIGLNLKNLTSTSNSSQIEYPIACLADLPGLGQSQLIPIWQQLTQSLSDILHRYMNSGFEQFIPDWNQWHLFQDQLVEIQDENTAVLTGKCRGINDYGAIIIETTDGIKTIHNGTLSLKKCP
jgi:BirA family biotin operon repressor/biotin-[acetyl-CoA-carboxylase] ligase